ncbi:MAG TPA: PqqD family protein [Actinomycetes bacterium]
MEHRGAPLPAARTERLIIRDFGDEAVVFDVDTERVTHLDAVTAAVWRCCDGDATLVDVSEATLLTEEDVALALLRLQDAGLLTSGGTSRRALLRRAGTVAVLVPLLSMAAATAAAASSVRTVTATQSGCTPFFVSWITLDVAITGFTPGTVNITVSYRNFLGNPAQATGVITANASGAGSTTVQLVAQAGAGGDQTVTVTASRASAPLEVTTISQGIKGC